MAGEHIEDMTIDLLKINNENLERRCNFLPNQMSNADIQELLLRSMTQETVQSIIGDPCKRTRPLEQLPKDQDRDKGYVRVTRRPVKVWRFSGS